MVWKFAVVVIALSLSGCGRLGRAEECDPSSEQQNNSGCQEHLSCSQVFASNEGEGTCGEGEFQCFAICDTDADCVSQPDGATQCIGTPCGLKICSEPVSI